MNKDYISKLNYFIVFLLIIIFIGTVYRFVSLDKQFLEYDEAVCMISGLKFHHQSFQAGKEYASDQPPFGKYTFGIFTAFDKKNDYSVLQYIPANVYGLGFLASGLIKANLFKLRLSAAVLGLLILILVYVLSYVIYRKHLVSILATSISAISADFISHSRFIQMSQNALFGSLLCLVFYFLYLNKDKKYKYLYLFLFAISYLYTINSKVWPTFILSLAIGIHYLLFLYYQEDKAKSREEKMKNVLKGSLEFVFVVFICLLLTYIVINPEDEQTYRRMKDLELGFSLPYFLSGLLFRNSYIFLFLEIISIYVFLSYKEKKGLFSLETFSKKEFFPLLMFTISLVIYGFSNMSDPYKFKAHFFGYLLNTFALMTIGLAYICYYFIYNTSNPRNTKYKEFLIMSVFLISLVSITIYYPIDYYKYANFGVSTDYEKGYASVGWHAYPWNPDTLNSMFKEYHNMTILTLDYQFLVFFPGLSSLYPMNHPSICNDEVIKNLVANKDKILIIDYAKDFESDYVVRRSLFCNKFFNLSFTNIRNITGEDTVTGSIYGVYKIK